MTGWLIYDQQAHKPAPAAVSVFDPYDDFTLMPKDGLELYEEADQTVMLDVTMGDLGNGAN